MLSSQSFHHYKMALLCDSTTSRIECFNDAVESSRQALALSPNSISFALFHAILFFQLALNDAGSYDALVQEWDRVLLIENPDRARVRSPGPGFAAREDQGSYRGADREIQENDRRSWRWEHEG
ncbi:hypothetical protein FH972_009799 [Carpinus fangiana]|uniref:Uncharacterized protein n=1 Tax=Carpinus fangiana TaxID=176857 RepID=A0A660KSG9_9ROSI|nr:hypothetical protein FH972_009799 [Carpinus fangiana]